jgi:hypothetical protein
MADMAGCESTKSGLEWMPETGSDGAVGTVEGAVAEPAGWRGKVSELSGEELGALWAEALKFARGEIGRYACWSDQDEPVLASGYDGQGVVQAAFERLVSREAKGDRIFNSVEEVREELRALIKRRVRWLHERSETGLVVREWDVLPPGPNGELVSVFDHLPAPIARPDEALMRKEKDQLMAEFKAGFEGTQGKRNELLEVFRRMWNGEKRREIAQALGVGFGWVKALQEQLGRRLAKFGAAAKDGVAEMLKGFKEGE